jgi:probable F420-dependent oxidoreductase
MAQQSGRRMKIGAVIALGEGEMADATPHWADVRALAQAAERAGFDSCWIEDHLISRFPNRDERGMWECFTTLSALAATTSRIQLGPLVACTSFRNPTLLAKMSDTLDEISDGRALLGLGAGWHEPEYAAFGYPFDHLAARFEEALGIIVPLLREGRVDFSGEYYTARDAVLRPRGPSPNGPPIWIGASKPRMLRLTARYADAWHTAWHKRPESVVEPYERFKAACAEVGRDPATVELAVGTLARVLLPGEARPADQQLIAGPAEEVAEGLRSFTATGARHLTVIVEPGDVASIERFGPVLDILDRVGI